jgi:hypothetical protein
MKFKTFFFLALILGSAFFLIPQNIVAEEVITIEGVITGLGDNPDEFSALMNQGVYEVGDPIGGYVVVTVDAKGVALKKKENDETQYYLVGTKIGEAKITESSTVEEKQETKEDLFQRDEKVGLAQKMTSYLSDIKSTVQQLQYGAVVEDLKRIQIAAMERALMTGNSSSVSIAQLIADGALPPLFKDSQNNGYYFKILPLADGRVRTSAAPVEKEISKPYFLIDEHRYVYIEQGKLATQESPLFSSQSQIQVSSTA